MALSCDYSELPQTSGVGDYIEEEKLGEGENGLAPKHRPRLFPPILLKALLHGVSLIFGIGIGALIVSTAGSQPGTRPSSSVSQIGGTVAMIDGIETAGTRCGSNWQEAKAMGCHFDVMASRWYAPECFDQSALEGMLDEQPYVNFTWYVDKEHTKIYPSELVLRGEFDKVYPSGDYHIYHCLYLWRRLHHAVLKNKPVDEDLFKYGHTLHCTRMIMHWMDPTIPRTTISSATSGTPFCRSSRLGIMAEARVQ